MGDDTSRKGVLIDAIKRALPGLKEEIFTAEHAPNATDAEAIGIVIAGLFDFDGLQVLRTAQWALEDANFHAESGVLMEMADKEEAS